MTGTMSTEAIYHMGVPVLRGESFHPFAGDDYSVTYVGIRQTVRGEELVLVDRAGEFARPITQAIPDSIVLSEN
ncbi:hypothetical protein ABT282_07300 [Streptomyces sp. NPDC000927]|uniref:hypothetical protein n=1 Tax=Streptomyces sp. NPDC000927 TaxID=3154371 RepID=UPI003316F3DA